MKTLILVGVLAYVSASFGASTIDPSDRYAFGSNVGWIDAKANDTDGAAIGRFYCTGNLYGANVGWISLGSGTPANHWSYANDSATDYGVNHDGKGNLRGYAYGANIGWLNFEDNGSPKVNLRTGTLSGYIWGANIGWISLSNAYAFVLTDKLDAGPDANGDGLPDAWVYMYTNDPSDLSGLDGHDADLDGASDLAEYLADTDPLNASDFFRITSFSVLADTNTVVWTSCDTRLYRVETTTNLANAASWADAGLGLQGPTSGSTQTGTVSGVTDSNRAYRVNACLPLAP